MDKKLKIAVFHNLPEGGAIKALQDNLMFLKNNGHTIDIYIPDTANDSFSSLKEVSNDFFVFPVKKSKFRNFILNFTNKIFPFINIPNNSRVRFSFKEFKNVQKEIADDIDSKDYDIVFSEQDILFTFSPAFLMYVKTPLIYYCQQPFRSDEKILLNLKDNNNNSISTKIYSRFFEKKYVNLDIEYAQYANNILVNSYFSHENLLRIYGKNSQVSYLGINNELFSPSNTSRKNYILSVGVFGAHKGFDFIVNAVGNIDKDIRPDLLIVSYNIHQKWLNYVEKLAEENQVNMKVLEGISYEELIKLYNEAKLFVFGSYLEPFGLVSLEALACGTPVVAVNEGGIREIVKHNENGFLVDRDEKLFAKYITELLTNQELWDEFSKNGPVYVNNYWTLNHAGQRLLDHIYRVLDEENDGN